MTRRVHSQSWTQRTRTAVIALFMVVAGGAGALLAPPAALGVGNTDSTVSWSVRPADQNGPDGRSWVELELKPGETATEYAAVTNLGDAPAVFALSAADAYLTDTGRFAMLTSSEPSTDGGTWVSVQESVDLAPGQTIVVPFTVSAPEDATPGDHPAGIAASITSAGTAADGNAVSVESRVGFRVMTRVAGEIVAGVDVADVTVSYDHSWNPFEPGALTLRLRAVNSGNVAVTVADEVRISGRTAETGDDEDATALFPGDDVTLVREVDGVWPLGFLTGEVILSTTVDGEDAPSGELESTPFAAWAVPWPQLLAVGGIALVLSAVLVNRRRRERQVTQLVAAAREEGRQSASSAPASSAP